MNNIVNVKPVIVADAPEAHQVRLDAGCQHFTIGEYCETKDEAEWLASQLRIALANTASQSSRGEAVYQWREIGEREWREAPSKEYFDNRDSDPTCDTRILYTEPGVVAGEVITVKELEYALNCLSVDVAMKTPDYTLAEVLFARAKDYRQLAALTAAIGRGDGNSA